MIQQTLICVCLSKAPWPNPGGPAKMLPFSVLVLGDMSIRCSGLVIGLGGRRSESTLLVWRRKVVLFRRPIILCKLNQLHGISARRRDHIRCLWLYRRPLVYARDGNWKVSAEHICVSVVRNSHT